MFLKLLVLEDVPPHPVVPVNGSLPRQIMGDHSRHDLLGRRRSLRAIRRNEGSGRKQKHQCQ